MAGMSREGRVRCDWVLKFTPAVRSQRPALISATSHASTSPQEAEPGLRDFHWPTASNGSPSHTLFLLLLNIFVFMQNIHHVRNLIGLHSLFSHQWRISTVVVLSFGLNKIETTKQPLKKHTYLLDK